MTLSIDKDNLYDLYFIQNLTKRDICKKLKCSERAINSRFKEWGWSFRKAGSGAAEFMKKQSPIMNEEENIKRMYYDEKLTCKDIGIKYGLGETSIARFLKKRGCILRNSTESQMDILDKNIIYDMYVNKKMSCDSISVLMKSNTETIRRNLIYHNIERRKRWEGLEKYNLEYLDNLLKEKSLIRVTFLNSLHDIKNRDEKIKVKCLIDNHIWECRVKNLLQGGGCPICRYKGERYTYETIVEMLGVGIHRNYKLCSFFDNTDDSVHNIFVDIYFKIKDSIFVVEYNGEQHYECVKWSNDQKNSENKFQYQKRRDNALREYCKRENITLIEIDGRLYNDRESIKQIVNQKMEGIL